MLPLKPYVSVLADGFVVGRALTQDSVATRRECSLGAGRRATASSPLSHLAGEDEDASRYGDFSDSRSERESDPEYDPEPNTESSSGSSSSSGGGRQRQRHRGWSAAHARGSSPSS